MAPPDGFLPYGRTPAQAHNTRDIGATTQRWRTAYLGTSVDVQVDNATNTGVTRGLTLSHTTSGTAAAGIGAGLLMRAENAAGTLKSAGALDAIHTTATDAAEVSAVLVSAGIAGSLLEVARFAAVASAVNGIAFAAAAAGGAPSITARGGDTNINVMLGGKGSGVAALQGGNGQAILGVSNAGLMVYADTQTGASPTVSRPAGKVRVQSGQTSVTVTNTLAQAGDHVHATIQNAATNAVYIKSAVATAGQIVITLSGDPGASHADIVFLLVHPLT